MSIEKDIQVKKLLKNYTEGKASEEELKVFFGMLNATHLDDYLEQHMDEEIHATQKKYDVNRLPIMLWAKIAVAASLVVVLFGVWFYAEKKEDKFSLVYERSAKIHPGKNIATLTLANGKKIALSKTKSGITVGRDQLTYNDGSLLEVEVSSLLTVSTPKGGTYQIDLPDGTKVWLNAESSLTFPQKFKANERLTELRGEGYFEVSKVQRQNNSENDRHIPFVVMTKNQKVEVLGTHFNINSYNDEPVVKTTLLEGAVKVSALTMAFGKGAFLKPGQQSVLKAGRMTVEEVEAVDAVAWKNGLFLFNNESLESVMRKISRWYNVKVEYKNEQIKKDVFLGSISRSQNLAEVLKMLKETGDIQFEWKGTTLMMDEN